MTDGVHIPPLQESAKVTTEINPEGPGPRLKAAREAAGFHNIKDVALHLRLSPGVITQIDQDIYAPEIAQVFMKGYLRSYAKLVGLNGDEVITEYLALVQEEERDISRLVTQPKSKIHNMPHMNVQARPAIFWGSSAILSLAFVGILWAYTAQPAQQGNLAKATNVPASVITQEVVEKVAEQSKPAVEATEQVAAQKAPAPSKEAPLPKPISPDSQESLLF